MEPTLNLLLTAAILKFKMAAIVRFTQNGFVLYNCYLSIKFYKLGIKMTAINSLTHIGSIHTNMEDSSKHIRQHLSKMCFFNDTAHAHLQLQTFRFDIIWIISNEIILLLLTFNLIPTSFRYCINYWRNPTLTMVGVFRHISKCLWYILIKYIERKMIETQFLYLSLYISGLQSQGTIYKCHISET
jgi:hypothetical protein